MRGPRKATPEQADLRARNKKLHEEITGRKRTEQELDHYVKQLRIMASELMLAEARERQRLAQQLHDGVGHALFRARMTLDELSIAEPKVKDIAAILEEMGKMINTMMLELSPIVLHKLGLRHAVRSLAANLKERYHLVIEIDDDGRDIIITERMAVVLFRSIHELLINIAKHAKTKTARVSLRKIGSRLQVQIEDRGRGFDLSDPSCNVESGHLGLFSLRERLEYLGGTINMRSAPGQGTSVTLNAPLSRTRVGRDM